MTGNCTPLSALGWNGFFESYYHQALEDPSLSHQVPARVVGEERGMYQLANTDGTFPGVIAGRLRYLAEERLDLPAIGDWVLCSQGTDSQHSVIHSVFPRQTRITRKEAGRGLENQILAANVDCAFIVTSANADFNPARLQRYVTAARDGGVEPVIVLTKVDLCVDPGSLLTEIREALPYTTVHAISVHSDRGVNELYGELPAGKTFVFLGSSGVGKSTLLNRLLGKDVMATQSISSHEDKGRHTTTSRHLFALPSGALVIDTPGIRELRLGGFEQGLEGTYEDILALAGQCRFSDCHHQGEPGCAVEQALKDGSLTDERWNWYLKLRKEVEYQERRESGEAARNTKARWKKIHQQAKQIHKRKRWGG